ncbi:GNAT family N-acetyltransferase [Roseovarius pelagicus]|uniref:GNAT family N-acetyltransferase n=1 Tax=Roseovarius pelagicus TaxID=2980108 RepID=A0ABY6DFB0_9RHOB|nr:GNAT family N-acetyltransferase [Roseovarius pelagicus]UXX84839.1 GNAT family N-acetyltransferase [Roseovarius pelagicus]
MNDAIPTIRAYHADDIEPVMAAWRGANALAHPFLATDFVAEVEQAIRNIYVPQAETYVLEVDGAVVGFIALLGAEIGGLFLDPAQHGNGYGRAMVDHAVALKGPLRVDVFRDNAIGRAFYERYGFEFVADELHEPSGQMNRTMAMPGA